MTDEPKHQQIFIRADDFGVTNGTNRAILDAVDGGSVRLVGVMAVGPALPAGVDALRRRQDNIAVGLHACINSEWSALRWGPLRPAGQVPGLVAADGAFHPRPIDTAESAETRETVVEVEAQLARLRSLGLEPTYLDTHMGFSWLPGVEDFLRDLCQREGLHYLDHPSYPKLHLETESDWSALPLPELLGKATRVPADGKIWVWHPAYRDEAAAAFGPEVAAQRDREARLLTRPDFLDEAAAYGLRIAGIA